ncbi:MAG TPA: DUF58 domain-containing protein [Bryobacteraceae bacterium]|nr:DUF58 domain-containing protein [Bryobacteraceae bacterium]
MAQQQSIIDRSFLEKLERLAMRWHKSFPGLVGGHNLSHFSGQGQEFLDHRHFHSGDDLRAVNWRAYMRFEKLFLKMFRVEPHTPVRMLLDTSESMATGELAKFDYACRLAAALCYVGLVRLDSIVIQPFAEGLADCYRCSGGRHRFGPAADFLGQLKPGGRTDTFHAVRQFISAYPQRGLLIVISDFLDPECDKSLQYLADFGHELMLAHLWSEEDRVPPWEGELELIDAETGSRLDLEFDSDAREQYTAGFDEWRDRLRRLATRNGGRFASLCTSTPIEEAVFGPLVQAGGVE